jgi:hypothetical protein
VNYGFGYTGVGFVGGRWVGGSFAYNRSVTNVTNIHVTNVYNETVINSVSVTRVSYNGGTGGTRAAPTAIERVAEREPHIQPMPIQHQHAQEAQRNPALFARANGGRPPIAATPHPAVFNAPGVVHARGWSPPPERPDQPSGQIARRDQLAAHPQGSARIRGARPGPQHPNAARKPGKRPGEKRRPGEEPR